MTNGGPKPIMPVHRNRRMWISPDLVDTEVIGFQGAARRLLS